MNTFGQNLSSLINSSLNAGVPAQEVILCLEVTKVELINSLLANAAGANSLPPAQPDKPLILMPGGNS